MLQKKKWIVKMVILDAKDAKISDISQIKCFDNSSKNLNITSKNAKNDKKEPVIRQKISYTPKNAINDAKESNNVNEGSAKRKEPRVRAARIEAENLYVQRNLRSSKKNTANFFSNLEVNKCNPTMPGFSDKKPIKKKNKILKLSALAHSTLDKSPRKSRSQTSEREEALLSSPLSSDIKLTERSSRTTQECGPSMPDLINLNESGISPRKSSWKFEYKNVPAKIEKRRSTICSHTMNGPKLAQLLLQEEENVLKSKGVRRETTTSVNTLSSADQKDPQSELLESLAHGRKQFFENFTRNKNNMCWS